MQRVTESIVCEWGDLFVLSWDLVYDVATHVIGHSVLPQYAAEFTHVLVYKPATVVC